MFIYQPSRDPSVGGSGETNTTSNVGTAGVGVYKQKTGVNFELKKINAGSSKVTITDDTGNSEIDIDVAEANLTLANIGGSIDLGGAKASGTMAAARMPALTGDVTNAAGSVATTIASGAVTNAKLANSSANTIKANATASAAAPADIAVGTNQVLLRGSANLAPHTLRRNFRIVGTNLDVGDHLYYWFKTAITPDNPNQQHVRFDTTDVNTITTMRIHGLDADLVSQVTRINLLKVGDRFAWVSMTSPMTVISTWAVTAAPVEVVDAVNGNYYNVGVDYIAGVIPTASLDPCELRHYPANNSASVTQSSILIAMPSAARFSFGGVGGAIDGFLTATDQLVTFVNPTYSFSSLPTITPANDGSVARIDPASFGGGSSRVNRNIQAVANLTDNAWDPVGGRQLLYSAYGSVAAPLANMAGIVGNAITQFDLGADGNFSIPANFLKLGRGLNVIVRAGKTGTSAGTTPIATRFGKNNTTSDQLISSVTLTNTSLQQCNLNSVARVTAVGAGTSVFTADSLGSNGQGTNSIGDRSTSFDSTLVNYVSVTADPANDTDTHALYSLEIWWVK